jgi:hypothetical protein
MGKEYVYVLIEENDLESENYSEVIAVMKDKKKIRKELKARVEVAKNDLNYKEDRDEIDVQEDKFYVENKTSTITGRIERHVVE